MEPIVIELPGETAVRNDIRIMDDTATSIVVTDRTSHSMAQQHFSTAKNIERAVRDLFAEPKRKANDAHKSVCRAETQLLEPVLALQSTLNKKITAYAMEQRRIEEAERRRLEVEARQREQERLQSEAEAAELSGDTHAAEEILREAIAPPTPTVFVESNIAKTVGVSERTTWSAEVVSLHALIKYVAEVPSMIALIEVNMTVANGMARSLKGGMNIPGLRALSSTSTTVRRPTP